MFPSSSFFQVFCIFFVFLSYQVFAAKTMTAADLEKRLGQNWIAINKWAQTPVTYIQSDDEFTRQLVRSPRNYTIVLLWNSDRECVGCRKVDTTFVNFANTYHEQFREKNSTLRNNPLYFIRVPVERLYQTAMKLHLITVPALMFIPPVSNIGFPHKSSQILYYHHTTNGIIEYEIAEFLKERTGVHVKGFVAPIPWKDLSIFITLGIIGLPFLLLISLAPYSKITWFYACLAIYFLNMSGFIGNSVHDNSWYNYNMWTGEYVWMQPGLQRQFRLEGYVGGALILCISLSFIGIQYLIPKVKSAMMQRLIFLILFLTMIGSANTWLYFYCQKNTMYPFKFYFEWDQFIAWGKTTLHDLTTKIMKP